MTHTDHTGQQPARSAGAGRALRSQTAGPGRPATETVRGIVQAANLQGIRLDGRWRTYSRYARVPRAVRGQLVEAQLQGDFVVGVTVLAPASDTPPPTAPAASPVPTDSAIPPPKHLADAPEPAAQAPARVAMRLALLQAAAAFLAGREDTGSEAVVTLAAAWEAWALGAAGPPPKELPAGDESGR